MVPPRPTLTLSNRLYASEAPLSGRPAPLCVSETATGTRGAALPATLLTLDITVLNLAVPHLGADLRPSGCPRNRRGAPGGSPPVTGGVAGAAWAGAVVTALLGTLSFTVVRGASTNKER